MYNLKIDKQQGVPVSPDMYGLFFEDINYSLDGGLHAEMLENRNFEAMYASGIKDDFHVAYDGGYGWQVYEDGGAGSYMHFDTRDGLNSVNPHYMVFESAKAGSAFSNKAYDGIYLKAGMKYKVSFYGKAADENTTVEISVRKYGKKYVTAKVELKKGLWQQYAVTFLATESVEQGDFVVSVNQATTLCFDQFSMMPQDAVCGVFRRDLVEKLEGLKPSFIRFPGGCIVEGNTLSNRYQWKETIGKVTERKFNWNRWAVHNNEAATGYAGPYPHYGQTYGVGYYEYFLLCEYLKAAPLPIMNVGLACQFMSSEVVEPDSDEMQQYIQDALDLIEFANGDESTTWGAKRCEMGHPKPFGLTYLGVGNEQWETEKVQFYKRYEMFEKKIHAVYPTIKIIGTSGPDVWGGGYFRAWEWAKEKQKKTADFMYAMDEHYYVSPQWLYEHVHFYDDYERKIKVFAGEYACHIPGRAGKMNCPAANNLEAALAEAAFLTGVERNADVVVLASYAPLFARMGYTQWSPDLIWFDGKDSYTTPSYYVQQLYSLYRGVKTCSCDLGLTQEELQENLYASAVELEDGRMAVKVVNGADKEREVSLEGVCVAAGTKASIITLSGNLDDKHVEPKTQEVTLTHNVVSIQPNSFTVICF
jgi:alpha-L-arabinofuranosidase